VFDRPAVDLLRDNGLAREAFRFANQAMPSACPSWAI
jgi:hypothetical protein